MYGPIQSVRSTPLRPDHPCPVLHIQRNLVQNVFESHFQFEIPCNRMIGNPENGIRQVHVYWDFMLSGVQGNYLFQGWENYKFPNFPPRSWGCCAAAKLGLPVNRTQEMSVVGLQGFSLIVYWQLTIMYIGRRSTGGCLVTVKSVICKSHSAKTNLYL